jgi:cyclophilin family peptidyl-prolyl cis-trans isomerase
MTFDFTEKQTRAAIENESRNGLSNEYKTVAMARSSLPHSATSQFYINLQSNPGLDATDAKLGYTVFGRVIDGIAVLEKIAKEPRGMFKAYPEAPNYAVIILSATRYNAAVLPSTASASVSTSFKDALVAPE